MRYAGVVLAGWLLMAPPVGYGGGEDGTDFVILHGTAIVKWDPIGLFRTADDCEHANDQHYHAAGVLLKKGASDPRKQLGRELFLRCVPEELVRGRE